MPNIKKVKLPSTVIKGLSVRTKNIDEMSLRIQKISPLWNEFYSTVFSTLEKDTTIYGVYHNYESDVTGEFDVLVGTELIGTLDGLGEVILEEGQYLMFPVKGELPQAIIETWVKVWAYFEDESIDERRAYVSDFEKYISADEAEIYIGVNYF